MESIGSKKQQQQYQQQHQLSLQQKSQSYNISSVSGAAATAQGLLTNSQQSSFSSNNNKHLSTTSAGFSYNPSTNPSLRSSVQGSSLQQKNQTAYNNNNINITNTMNINNLQNSTNKNKNNDNLQKKQSINESSSNNNNNFINSSNKSGANNGGGSSTVTNNQHSLTFQKNTAGDCETSVSINAGATASGLSQNNAVKNSLLSSSTFNAVGNNGSIISSNQISSNNVLNSSNITYQSSNNNSHARNNLGQNNHTMAVLSDSTTNHNNLITQQQQQQSKNFNQTEINPNLNLQTQSDNNSYQDKTNPTGNRGATTNVFYNPQGGDSDSCYNNQRNSGYDNNNNNADNEVDNGDDDDDDDSTSYLNPFNKNKKKSNKNKDKNRNSNTSHLQTRNRVANNNNIHDNSNSGSQSQRQLNSNGQTTAGMVHNNTNANGLREQNSTKFKNNNTGSEEDGSGSEFSAEEGSPPDHQNKKSSKNALNSLNVNGARGSIRPKHLSLNGNGLDNGGGGGAMMGLKQSQMNSYGNGSNSNDMDVFKTGGGVGGVGGDSTSDLSTNSPLLKEMRLLKNVDKYIIPPPEDLIAKTVFTVEPIRTGAPISFVKVDNLRGEERDTELMNEVNRRGAGGDADGYGGALGGGAQQTRSGLRYIAEEIVKFDKDGKVVYCRFGKQYIINLEKQMNSILNAGTGGGANGNNAQLSQAIKSATYLINIKKLIKEHNIDTEYNNFQKLRTKSNVVNKQNENGPALPYYQLQDQNGEPDRTLLFESRFESGNLLCAIKVTDNEYDLVLQNDINTNGHTQWYFFRVGNCTKGMKVKFNILNLAKTDSLYNEGMKILAFSSNLKKGKGLGWHRVGYDISYYQNAYRRENMRQVRYYYTFTFSHEFEGDDGDSIYFAHCFPYTYSDLQDDLSRIEKDSYTQNFFYRNTLCRTLAGNKCEYITITSKEKEPVSKHNNQYNNPNNNNNQNSLQNQENGSGKPQKMGVFLSARVHPGESNASWMMKGLIDFLVSNTPEARVLREKFVFKIVPMINPDGVINGNYRCSLCGSDLNRRWKTPSKVLHPVVFSIKRMVKAFSKEREIALYCDFHGHSRRKNIFMYGNNYADKPDATRMFPYILSKLCDYFSFELSRFSMHKSKEATARIAMWKELRIPNIFTIEASFSGADKGQLKDQHFTTEHLMNCGKKLLEALIVYCKIDVQATLNELAFKGQRRKSNQGPNNALECKEDEDVKTDDGPKQYLSFNMESLQKELIDNKELLKMTEGKGGGDGDGEGEGSSGSDSDPSEDNLEEEEMAKIVPIKIKKKKPEPPKKKSLSDARGLKKNDQPVSPNKKTQQKPVARSPAKKIFNYSNPLYDRLKLRQLKKIEMVDAWTQTSDRGSDNEEAHRLRRVGSQAAATTAANQKSKNSLLPSSSTNAPPNNQSATQSFVVSNLNASDSNSTTINNPSTNILASDPYFQMNQTQKVVKHDSGSSPQPQIRIRKEPFKQPSTMMQPIPIPMNNTNNNNNNSNNSGNMPTNLQKFEDRLINNSNHINAHSHGVNSNANFINTKNDSNTNSAYENQDDNNFNSNSSRLSKTPKDNRTTNSNAYHFQNSAQITVNPLGLTQTQSMKVNNSNMKAPYGNQQNTNNQVYGDNNDGLQARQFNKTNHVLNFNMNSNINNANQESHYQNQPNINQTHNRHYSSENFGGFNIQPVTSNNALSSRGFKDSGYNNLANQNAGVAGGAGNNHHGEIISTTAVTSPKSQSQIRNSKHLSSSNHKHYSQKLNGLLSTSNNNNNNNQFSLIQQSSQNQSQLPSSQLQMQQTQNLMFVRDGNMQQQNDQQRFRSSIMGREIQESTGKTLNSNIMQQVIVNNNGQGGQLALGGGIGGASFSNQRQSVQNSIEKNSHHSRINQLSNKKRLPEIGNDAQRLSQKNTIDQLSNNYQASNSYTAGNANLLQHQNLSQSQHIKHQSHSQYKYSLNSSAQQIVRNSNIYSIQQQLIKNYGGNGPATSSNNTSQSQSQQQQQNQQQLQPGEQVLYQAAQAHHIAKSVDRNSYMMNRAGAAATTSNPISSGQMNIHANSDYQNRAYQQQIQLQNVKMRTNNNNNNDQGSNNNNANNNKTPQKYL